MDPGISDPKPVPSSTLDLDNLLMFGYGMIDPNSSIKTIKEITRKLKSTPPQEWAKVLSQYGKKNRTTVFIANQRPRPSAGSSAPNSTSSSPSDSLASNSKKTHIKSPGSTMPNESKNASKVQPNSDIGQFSDMEEDKKIQREQELILEANAKLLQSEKNAKELLEELEKEKSLQKAKEQTKERKREKKRNKRMAKKILQVSDNSEDIQQVIQDDCSVYKTVSTTTEILQKTSLGDSQDINSLTNSDDCISWSKVKTHKKCKKNDKISAPKKEKISSQVIPRLSGRDESNSNKSRDTFTTVEKSRKFQERKGKAITSRDTSTTVEKSRFHEGNSKATTSRDTSTTVEKSRFHEGNSKATTSRDTSTTVEKSRKCQERNARAIPPTNNPTFMEKSRKLHERNDEALKRFPSSEMKKNTQFSVSSLQKPESKKTSGHFPADAKKKSISGSAYVPHRNSTYPSCGSSPTPPFAFKSPTPMDAFTSPTPMDAFTSPTPMDAFTSPTPRDAFTSPTPRDAFTSPTPMDAFTSPTPMDAFTSPTPRDAFTSPTPMDVFSSPMQRSNGDSPSKKGFFGDNDYERGSYPICTAPKPVPSCTPFGYTNKPPGSKSFPSRTPLGYQRIIPESQSVTSGTHFGFGSEKRNPEKHSVHSWTPFVYQDRVPEEPLSVPSLSQTIYQNATPKPFGLPNPYLDDWDYPAPDVTRPIGCERQHKRIGTPVRSPDNNPKYDVYPPNLANMDTYPYYTATLTFPQLNTTSQSPIEVEVPITPFGFLGPRFYEEAKINEQIQMELLREVELLPKMFGQGQREASRYSFAQPQPTDIPTAGEFPWNNPSRLVMDQGEMNPSVGYDGKMERKRPNQQ